MEDLCDKKDLPARLYKYTSVESAIKILTSETILFNSPENFNDPYDANPPFEFTKLNKEELIKYSKSTSDNIDSIDDKVCNYANKEIQKNFQKLFSKLRHTARILCLSATNESILMWAHYATSHTGVVIEFDTNQFVIRLSKDINYDNNIVEINMETLFKKNDESIEEFHKIYRAKSEDWDYEKEYRAFINIDDKIVDDVKGKTDLGENWKNCYNALKNKEKCIYFPIAKEAIKAIYLGCNIKETDKMSILNIIKGLYPHVKCYKAIKSETSFKLTFEEVNV